jgi:P4 family phage/plasmid primase-like protien
MARKDKSCKQCEFYFDRDNCERAEYKSSRRNREAYELHDYAICDYFKPKKGYRTDSEFDMGEALALVNEGNTFVCPTDTRELLGYSEGHYVPFETKVHKILEDHYGEELKSFNVEEVIKHLQRANYIEREEINKFTNKIPVKNGLLNILTRDLEKFSPKEIFTYKLNVEYDPSKECSEWLKFLNKTLRKEDTPLLQENMGYCLLPEMPFHKLFWFYGSGRNGKDRVIKTLEYILGEENTSHLNLGEFRESRRFSLCQLYGKLLNISSEPESKYSISTNILKLISGENLIHAELKGKNNRLAFINKSKVIVVGNAFPKVEDSSVGFWERVEVLNFPFSFTGKDCVPNIEKKWLPEEASGILNWMLEGLYRLKENGQFSTSKTTEETKAEFMRVSDPFRAWINDCCVFIPVGKVTRDEAYTSYKNYAEELGGIAESTRSFYNKMKQTPKITEYRSFLNKKTERGFKGLILKETGENGSQSVLNDSEMSSMSGMSDITYPQQKQNINNISKIENIEPDISDIPDIQKRSFDVDEAFKPVQCFDCGRRLTDQTPFTYWESKPFCFTCFNKIKAQKKKYCKHLDLENQICKHPEGNERGIVNIQLCSLEASKKCELLHPEEEGS